MDLKTVIIIDNNSQSRSDLCGYAKKLNFDTLGFSDPSHVFDAIQHCSTAISAVCNLTNQELPSQKCMNALKEKNIPITIFSDIPGINYINNHFFMGVSFFKGPANKFLFKYALNEFIPSETPRENLSVKIQILNKMLKNTDFSKMFRGKINHSISDKKIN